MKKLDAMDLDGRLLQTFLCVIEVRSVTQAAARLQLTQSAVSHQLERLRAIVGDELFVKSGRGIAPTAHAAALAERAPAVLAGLQQLVEAAHFDPAAMELHLTVAANDLQRDLLLPDFLERVRAVAPGFTMRVIASGAPRAELLRDGPSQLLITPRPPDASDLMHVRLLEDRYAVFFDGSRRAAPTDTEDYLRAEHVTVVHEPHRTLDIDDQLARAGIRRRFVVEVPGFAGIGPFLRGTPRLATLPSLLSRHLLRGFAQAPVPVPCPVMPMYLVWHLRHHDDARHRWLRGQLQACAAQQASAGD